MALQPGQEYPPPDEQAAIAKLNELHLKVHQVQPGPNRRGEHPKTHCGVWARFDVVRDVPAAFQSGVFASRRSYTALVRFSNGRTDDDRNADVHGMAVKVLVPQEDTAVPVQQDFILADHPIFFARNVEHLYEFLVATSGGTPAAKLAVTTHPGLVGYTKVPKTSLSQMTFWSQTPYQLGAGAVKYIAVPSPDQEQPVIPLEDSANALRDALGEQLTAQKIGARFDLLIEPQTDADAMPVEDPTIAWTSPPIKLATIDIYPQKFDSPQQMAFVENNSWSPWNHLPQQRPLGGINRARQMVYGASRSLRYQSNSVNPVALTGREAF